MQRRHLADPPYAYFRSATSCKKAGGKWCTVSTFQRCDAASSLTTGKLNDNDSKNAHRVDRPPGCYYDVQTNTLFYNPNLNQNHPAGSQFGILCELCPKPPPATTCVTNGAAGVLGAGPRKGQKVPAGTPCTGWYQGRKTKHAVCKGTGYGGYGWCGVEAAPGTNGKYSKADRAWGGCVKACHPVATTAMPVTEATTTTAMPVTCDGSTLGGSTQHTSARDAHTSTGYEAPGQPLGTKLAFRCRPGYQAGLVTYTCGSDGRFRTSDKCTAKKMSPCHMGSFLSLAGSHLDCTMAMLGMGNPCDCLCNFPFKKIQHLGSCAITGSTEDIHHQWRSCAAQRPRCGHDSGVVVVHGRRLRTV